MLRAQIQRVIYCSLVMSKNKFAHQCSDVLFSYVPKESACFCSLHCVLCVG